MLSDDGTTDGSQVLKWTQLLIETTEIVGQPVTVAPKFKKMLEDAGFEDVQERVERWPISPWPENNSKHKELGTWSRAATLAGLEAFSLALFTRVLGWTKEEALVFCAEVREEFKSQKVHGYYNV